MPYTFRLDPPPTQTNPFRIGVQDGDRIVRPPTNGSEPDPPPPITSGDDGELWVMAGPPPAIPPPGAEPGDAWIDVATGDVFVLNPE